MRQTTRKHCIVTVVSIILFGLPFSQTLLQDHFGVSLTLQAPHDGGTNNSFDWTSFEPTLHIETVDYEESDWYGNWSWADFTATTIQHTPAPGTGDNDDLPSGGEPYDVEAMYFDNDRDNFYIAIVTSVAHAVDTDGDNVVDDVGVVDSRIDATRAFIRPGDLSISLFKASTTRQERNATTWCYNYGLDLVDEIRPNNDNTNEDVVGGYTTQFMRSINLGSTLYATSSDLPSTAADVVYPATGDWYTGSRSGHVTAFFEHTNIDPNHTQFTGTALGQASYVNYYEYTFAGGELENGTSTYVIEATIPRSLFGVDDPQNGDQVGIRWMPACRNDGEADVAVVKVVVTIDDYDYGDAPESVYPTSITNDGAVHTIDKVSFLGVRVDSESNGQPSTQAAGDDTVGSPDDEDGILFTTALDIGEEACFNVHASVNGYLNAWIDFNQLNNWADAGEHIYSDQFINSGTTNLCFSIPGTASQGNTYMRFRFTNDDPAGALSYTGSWDNGEVEDYMVELGTTLGTADIVLPERTKLSVPYPNPFNPVTHIRYELSAREHIKLDIYNMNGQKVETLIDDEMPAGYHAIEWDGSPHPSGIYLAVMRTAADSYSQKLILLK